MALSLIGKKLGMTRLYQPDGSAPAVTVIHVAGNQVLQVKKSTDKEQISAYQVGYDDQKESRLTKPVLGHIKKHGGATAKKRIRQFRVKSDEQLPESGTVLGAEVFPAGSWVDVIGVSKGHGFQGVVKRYGFAGQPQSHGSMMHRRPGSIGCRLTPGLVWKNQKMPGHMGVKRRTVQSLQVLQSRPEEGVVIIAGSVPGHKTSYVVLRPAIKNPGARLAKAEANRNANKGAKKDAKKK
jgi:large subunit ribosomal protein L3